MGLGVEGGRGGGNCPQRLSDLVGRVWNMYLWFQWFPRVTEPVSM